ncbi:condensin-2 complex subunit H2 isoform X2 [Trichomycterus rosablanca]|uniref:condensin-2 complex subunit H2 isoform X2 n=1 Tax=Trichomycterus rosablanca TaxID=2290929 RepID=UPI002F353CE2
MVLQMAPLQTMKEITFDAVGVEPSTHHVEMKSDPTEPVRIVQLPPESLISADALEKQDFPLLSVKGEVLGSYKDFHISNFMLDALGIICQDVGSSDVHILKDTSVIHPEGRPDEIVGNAGVYCENGDGGYGGEEILPLMDNDMEVEPEPEEHVERQQIEAPSERRMLRERPAVQPVAEEPKQLQEAMNPWKWHDPYENIGENKPLNTGKCYNVPAGLEESGKRKRKGPSKLQDFWGWCTSAYESTDRKLKNGPFYPEFNYIYLSKMGQRLKVRKKVLRKTGVYVSDEVLKRTYLEPEKQEEQDEVFRHGEEDGGDFSDHENENLVDHGPEDINGEHDPVFTDSQMGRISYEDLVKKSVELFLANSQKYIQETALSRRVKDWESEINPRLRAQEERLVFDIHDYGDRIVNALGAIGVKRSFASLVEGMENTEACRYMLASLQLANDYTVEIGRKSGLEESIDTMELTLLSKHRVHEQIKHYSNTAEQDLQ